MCSTRVVVPLLALTLLGCIGEVGAGNDGTNCCGGGQGGGVAGTGGGTGGGAGTGGGGSSAAGGSGALIAADRVTTWHPGILSDVPTGHPLGTDGLPVRTTVCADVPTSGDIQAAIDGCAANQVVQLAAGTYTISQTINLKSNVVLRGAGSGSGGTVISKSGGGPVIHVGDEEDQVCYSGNGRGIALTADAPKESTTLEVGSAASQFHVGDLVWIDQLDVAPVVTGDCQYFKRSASGTYRSIAQTDEVIAVDTAGGTLTVGSPLHWDYKAGGATKAEVVRQVNSQTTRWAGIEHLAVEGATAGYPGQHAAIDFANAAYSWVKDVQTNQTIDGMHIRLGASYRCVIRDSHVHHSANYGFGADCYGVVIGCGSAESLVENNIIRYMNKPMLFSVSGGGNVVGYNDIDNAWADNHWQEVNIDSHCSYSHMELIEGNLAPHMGLTSTHGNAGSFTYFRNFAPPATSLSPPTLTTRETPQETSPPSSCRARPTAATWWATSSARRDGRPSTTTSPASTAATPVSTSWARATSARG